MAWLLRGREIWGQKSLIWERLKYALPYLAPCFQVDEIMDFRISDTFTDSLNRLTGDEQKAVKTAAFDLQLNPANPGMKYKLNKARDKNFWSVRVSSDAAYRS